MQLKEKRSVNLFFILYLFYCFKSIVYSLTIDTESIIYVKHSLNFLILVLSFASIFYGDFKTKLFFLITLCLCIFNILLYQNDSYYAFLLVIAICTLSRKIDWSTLIGCICLVHIIVIILTIPFLYYCDYFFLIDDRFGPRFTGGFDNPNTLGQYLIMLLSIFTLWLNEKIKSRAVQLMSFCCLFILIFIILYESFSRTSLILASIMGGIFCITRLLPFKAKTNKYFLPFLILLFSVAIFQIYGVINFGSNKYLAIANEIFTSRLWFGNILYKDLGLPNLWHGQNINDYLPLDFYFVRTIYSVGIVYFILLLIILMKELKKCSMDVYMWAVLFIMLADTLTETYFSIPFYSVAVFIVFNKTNFMKKEG